MSVTATLRTSVPTRSRTTEPVAKFLLDTNVVSHLLRYAPPPLIKRLADTPRDQVAVSIVTAMELRFGLAKNPHATRAKAAVEAFLAVVPVANLPDGIPPVYGRVRADLEKRGTPIGPLDTMIAAHALAIGATLVTNNTKEFRRVRGLRCQDWTKRRRERQ
jgi:tRNA(fMet)-specific endonuclease VapC